MLMPVTAVFAAVTAFLLLFLSFQVSRYRLKYRQGLGVNDDQDFEVAVRAHGNLVEYAPLALILMGVGELNGVSAQWIYWLGMAFVGGRILHAFGMFNGRGGPHKARLAGILLTWLSIAVLAVLLIWNVVQLRP
ncbi:MAG: MAPEG family protein [Marinobacter sp.]